MVFDLILNKNSRFSLVRHFGRHFLNTYFLKKQCLELPFIYSRVKKQTEPARFWTSLGRLTAFPAAFFKLDFYTI